MSLAIVNQNPALGGGPLGWSSCNCACTAMLIQIETNGAKHPTTGDVRECVRTADGSHDVKGGTNPSQNVAAAQRCFGVTLDQRVMAFEDAWKLGQRADTGVSFSISYAVVSGTQFDGSPGFRGNHQVLLSGGLVYDPLADGRRAGIPRGPQKWPKDLLQRAAGKYAGTGVGRAAVIVGQAPKPTSARYSVLFAPGAIWTYLPDGSRQSEQIGKKTSAPSTAPFTIPWGAGRKRLVTLTDGFLMGRSVEPGATHIALVSR